MAAIAIFLALVLGSSAIHKLVDRDRLVAATGRLLRVNDALALPAMLTAAAIEAAAAIALLLPSARIIGAVLAGGLWLVYGAALLRTDNAADCGCSFGAHRRGIDPFTRVRPVALAALAAVVALMPASLGGYDVVTPFAGLALFAIYLAAAEIAANRSPVR